MESKIYVITGVMASGKSTVAECLAKRFDKAVHLRGDVFRKMIVSGRVEMSQDAGKEAFGQLHLRYEIAANVAKMYQRAGFTVVMQDNYLGEELTRLMGLLQDDSVQVVVLCPGADVVKERERTRGKTGYIGFTVEQLYDMFMETTPRIGLWIDSSDLTPEETVDVILK